MLKENNLSISDKLDLMRQGKDPFVKQEKNFKFPSFLIFLFEIENQESKQIYFFCFFFAM